ncbi:hypothetical protein PYJP_19140 [Pyrofollis japonicus]|nr:hypothetical protein PYJP_19140 [Pyrofollis japonicus]
MGTTYDNEIRLGGRQLSCTVFLGTGLKLNTLSKLLIVIDEAEVQPYGYNKNKHGSRYKR